MYINGTRLLEAAPIKDMVGVKVNYAGVSYGLTELGYDIRLKQDIRFFDTNYVYVGDPLGEYTTYDGKFCLASTIEEFQMPSNLGAEVKDKSTWARKGLSVFNTVIEPGWCGFLTLELVYHGQGCLHIPAGSGIAQVLFQSTAEEAFYAGKYQNQEDQPVEARMASSELVLPDTRPICLRRWLSPSRRLWTLLSQSKLSPTHPTQWSAQNVVETTSGRIIAITRGKESVMAKDDDIHAANLVAFMRATVIEEDKKSQLHLYGALQTIGDSFAELRRNQGLMAPKK